MKESKKGFVPVMLTPFHSNGEVDYKGLTKLTEMYLAAGASGLFANCLSSEMYELSFKERLSVTQSIVDVAAGQVPVVATGTFPGSTAEQIAFIEQIYGTGIEAVILITSLIAEENDSDQLFNARVHEIIEKTGDIPLGFYECPEPYKRVLSAEQLKEFVATGKIIYHKDTCLDIKQVREKLEATKGYDFGLYDAYIVHAIESLKAGSAGLSCIQGNYFPELIVWICDHYDDPEVQVEMAQVQGIFKKYMELMHYRYPTVAKYFLEQRGLGISTFSRKDVGQLSNTTKNDIVSLHEQLSQLCNILSLNVAQLS
jgi:4-hydroxy-tetrahydrodipicolinate synthase